MFKMLFTYYIKCSECETESRFILPIEEIPDRCFFCGRELNRSQIQHISQSQYKEDADAFWIDQLTK